MCLYVMGVLCFMFCSNAHDVYFNPFAVSVKRTGFQGYFVWLYKMPVAYENCPTTSLFSRCNCAQNNNHRLSSVYQ